MNVERTAALVSLGYTPRQAAFLVTAALHSGAFIARQYGDYTGTARGGTRDDLVSRLLRSGHANIRRTLDPTLLYQLRKPIFRTLGEIDNRNRRVLTDDKLVRRRLMGLDFALKHPQYEFLPTENEKLTYLTGACGVAPSSLPKHRYTAKNSAGHTNRFFIDKQPIFTLTGGAGFVYVDVDHSARCFETFLSKLRPLLVELKAATVVYVTTESTTIPAQTALFARFSTAVQESAGLYELEIEFRERQALEADVKRLAPAQLNRLADLRKAKHAFLFPEWQLNGLAALKAAFEQDERSAALRHVQFVPCVLPCSYRFLGGLS